VELDSIPDSPDYVRASINASGYIYRPVKGDPTKCFVQYVVNVDPKGWLPYWMVNLAASDQGSNVKNLQQYFKKLNKQKGKEESADDKEGAEDEDKE